MNVLIYFWLIFLKQIRLDNVVLPKVKKTSLGYLKGNSVVTSTGVLTYQNIDGSYRHELRLPEEVFKAESLESLKGIPVTNGHPAGFVDATNAAKVSIGMTGDMITVNDNLVISNFTITDAEAIDFFNARGRKEMSVGYSVRLDEESGVYEGKPYTHIQRDIVYNHLAVVDQARAGRVARMNMDGALEQCNNDNINEEIMEKENLTELLKRFDGIESLFKTNIDANNERVEKLQAELSKVTEERDAALLATKNLNTDSVDVNELVNIRTDIILKSQKSLNMDSLTNMDNREIMEKYLGSNGVDQDFSDKSYDYVSARFDSLVDIVNNNDGIIAQMDNAPKSFNSNTSKVNPLDLMNKYRKSAGN